MKITLDRGRCTLHGQCTLAAPTLFRFDDAGELDVVADPGEHLRQEAEDAMDSCPERAITIED